MQIMPNFYSEFGLSMINNFRFLFLYCIFLMACKYFIHISLVIIYVFQRFVLYFKVLELELISYLH